MFFSKLRRTLKNHYISAAGVEQFDLFMWTEEHVLTLGPKLAPSDCSNAHIYSILFHNVYPDYTTWSYWRKYVFSLRQVITKTCLFKCTENFTSKNIKFSDKKSDIFHISAQNHRLWVLVRTASARARRF